MKAKLYMTTSLGLRRVVRKIHDHSRSGRLVLVGKDLLACQKVLFGDRKRNCCGLILKCMTSSWRDLHPRNKEILEWNTYDESMARANGARLVPRHWFSWKPSPRDRMSKTRSGRQAAYPWSRFPKKTVKSYLSECYKGRESRLSEKY